MKRCEGCGFAFTTDAEIFGTFGQMFCAVCYMEEIELAPLRKPLEKERDELRGQISVCEDDIRRGQALTADADEKEEMFISLMQIDSGRERLADVEDELSCLTVAYQQKRTVIGRAA